MSALTGAYHVSQDSLNCYDNTRASNIEVAQWRGEVMEGYGMDGRGFREEGCGRDLGGKNEPGTVSELLISFKLCRIVKENRKNKQKKKLKRHKKMKKD